MSTPTAPAQQWRWEPVSQASAYVEPARATVANIDGTYVDARKLRAVANQLIQVADQLEGCTR